MKFYLAPLEGITNLFYRNAFSTYFGGVNKYFIPFINPADYSLSEKEKREIDPKNNINHLNLIPQIISKNAKETIWLINILKDLGYQEVNLNFGCPSGTVVSKNKGAGMLKDLDKMDAYLNEVFASSPLKISIKTRLGLNNEEEFKKILLIYNKYPLAELIIHPRTSSDKYNKPLRLSILDWIKDNTSLNLIYNGEIKTLKDINYIKEKYPFFKGIMVGRGLIANPNLISNILDESKLKQSLKDFYYQIKTEYNLKFGWNNTKFYLKEIWVLLINSFDIDAKLKKKLFKCEKEEDFDIVEKEVLSSPLKKEFIDGISN